MTGKHLQSYLSTQLRRMLRVSKLAWKVDFFYDDIYVYTLCTLSIHYVKATDICIQTALANNGITTNTVIYLIDQVHFLASLTMNAHSQPKNLYAVLNVTLITVVMN